MHTNSFTKPKPKARLTFFRLLPWGSCFWLSLILLASGLSSVGQLVRSHTGSPGEASTAVAPGGDANWMYVADNEDQVLRLYSRTADGGSVAAGNFDLMNGNILGLTDQDNDPPFPLREVDIEASTQVGNRIYWMGSMSNAQGNHPGRCRPNRNRFFATAWTAGVNPAYTLAYVGRYDHLRDDLINWDVSNAHMLGANHYGFSSAFADNPHSTYCAVAGGMAPEQQAGFNIEGLAVRPDGTSAWIAFRAPISPAANRVNALLIPLLNLSALVNGDPAVGLNPDGSGLAVFGAPVELNLGGLGIRSIEGNGSGSYVIVAGRFDGTSDFRLFTWDGPGTAPVARALVPPFLNAEGIVTVPPGTIDGFTEIQFVCDETATFRSFKMRLDAPHITIAPTDPTAYEGDGGAANTGTFTLTRTGGQIDQSITVYVSMTGSAINGTDYANIPTEVYFSGGMVTQTITVTPLDDAISEPDETVTATILPTSTFYGVGNPSIATVTIGAPTISIAATDATATEPGGADNATFTITRGGNLNQALTLGYNVDGSSTATLGTDYTLSPASVVFNSGDVSKTVTLTPLQDTVYDPNETVTLSLSPVGEYRVIGGAATATILENQSVTIVATDPNAREPDNGTDTGTFTFTRSGAQGNLSLTVAINNPGWGTATSGTDYNALPTSIMFQPNQPTYVLTVTPMDDTAYEDNETVWVQITASGAADFVTINSLFDLGVLPNQWESYGFGVNAAGSVVGTSGGRAFRDLNQVIESGDDLHPYISYYFGYPNQGTSDGFDITDGDRAVGEFVDPYGRHYAWYRGPLGHQALSVYSAYENRIRGIAPWQAGAQAAGWSHVNGYYRFVHWYIYDATPSYTYNYMLGGGFWYNSYAYAVADGRLVGHVAFPAGSQALFWDWNNSSYGFTYLPRASGDTQNEAYDISQYSTSFRVAGFTGNGTTKRGCYWTYSGPGNAPITTLSTPVGYNSTAKGINYNGKVVGSIHWNYTPGTTDQSAALWDNGTYVDLASYFGNSGWYMLSAEKINEAGAITGYGYHFGAIHAFLVRP